ncbi:ATPase [alpha proteobacterium U9-1i]|nr:ATPase [alpha proteobacterium U9-1i]
MRALVLAISALLMAWIGGGTAASAQDCDGANWRAIGFADGAERGSTEDGSSRVAEHVSQCGDRVDAYAYEGGFIDGLRAFCTPEHGFAMARAGQTYSGLCHEDQADAFGAALQQGVRVAQVETRLQEATVRKDALFIRRREINDAAREADGALGQMVPCGGNFCPNRPNAINWQRQQLEFRTERARVEEALHEAENLIPELEGQLRALRAEVGERYGSW